MLESVAELTAKVTRLANIMEPIVAESRLKRMQRLDPWHSNNRSIQEQTEFKDALLVFYACNASAQAPDKPMAKCMVSGKVYPQPVVIASHVWKHCTRGDGLEEFGLCVADINSPRNGLLMAAEIEAAFDMKRVSFSFNLLTDKFTFHVLDSTLLEKPILNLNDKKTRNSVSGYASLDPTTIPKFKELDNKEMTWTPPACPFRRLLAWHYAVATLHAQRRPWYKPNAPHPASVIGKPDWSKYSPEATWPSSDVLDLFDHALSKSERDIAEQVEQEEQEEQQPQPAAACTGDEDASST